MRQIKFLYVILSEGRRVRPPTDVEVLRGVEDVAPYKVNLNASPFTLHSALYYIVTFVVCQWII